MDSNWLHNPNPPCLKKKTTNIASYLITRTATSQQNIWNTIRNFNGAHKRGDFQSKSRRLEEMHNRIPTLCRKPNKWHHTSSATNPPRPASNLGDITVQHIEFIEAAMQLHPLLLQPNNYPEHIKRQI